VSPKGKAAPDPNEGEFMLKGKWRSGAGTVVVVIALAATLAACGSSSSSSNSGSSSNGSSTRAASTGPSLKGAPVKIMTMTPVTASSGTSIISPEAAAAATATTKWINAHGGINGHPLDDIVCNEQSDPNQDTACAREAVSDHVVAMVGTYSQYSTGIYPIIQKAGIANLGNVPVTAPDGTSPVSFPVNAGSAVLVALGQIAAANPACKSPGLVTIQNTAVPLIKAGMIGGVLIAGKKVPYSIVLPATSSDFSAQAAQAAHGGDCVMLFTVPGNAEAFIPALRQAAPTMPLIASNNALTEEVAKKLGSIVNGTEVPDYFPPYNSPALALYRSIMAKYSTPSKYDFSYYNATNAYLSVRVFAEIASKLKTINAHTFLAALNKAKNVSGYGLTPPLNFTPANQWTAVPFQKRIFNRNMVYDKVENGSYVQIDGGFHDLTTIGGKAFAAAAKAAG
jgi:branched-chain amino acid transport system substrate-binding protein